MTNTTLPPVTPMQFLFLQSLLGGSRHGWQLRTHLRGRGINRTPAAFYRMMWRLERMGFVRGWYTAKIVNDNPVKERCYQLTRRGARALKETRAFYSRGILGILWAVRASPITQRDKPTAPIAHVGER